MNDVRLLSKWFNKNYSVTDFNAVFRFHEAVYDIGRSSAKGRWYCQSTYQQSPFLHVRNLK